MSWRCAVATLADVARLAGVSQATASRIVNGSDKLVTDELRTRVLRAVAQLQYVPNAHAQQLARADRTAVGVIVHDVAQPQARRVRARRRPGDRDRPARAVRRLGHARERDRWVPDRGRGGRAGPSQGGCDG